jgi:acrylyl-CoA reductase (NADPH)
MNPFKAFVVSKTEDGKFHHSVEIRYVENLPKGDLLIRVHYSSINYKDCLSCIGNLGVTRHFPHTPGVDVAGIVEESTVDQFRPGDEVIIISQGLGTNIPGGFGQFVRAPANWAMKLPKGMSLHESMVFGTAGFTSALAIQALQHNGLHPKSGPIAVSGASGGVGSIAIAILSHLGYEIIAVTGKNKSREYLTKIGANEIIYREDLDLQSNHNLLKPEWAGAIDSLGGSTLSTLLKKCNERGTVVAVGNADSQHLDLTVLPFILRGIKLTGIFAEGTHMKNRHEIWGQMANEWKPALIKDLARTIQLESLSDTVKKILAGENSGRVVLSLI